MCDPITAIGTGLGIAGQIAGFAGSQAQTNAYNAAARQNAINASVAATNKYADEGKKLIYNTKANMQQGYDAAMAARQAKGTAVASAGSAGIDGSSLTLNSILADMDTQAARNQANIQMKQDDMHDSYNSTVRSYEAEAQGRINSMPMKSGPSGLGLGLGIATGVVDGLAKSPKTKNWLGG